MSPWRPPTDNMCEVDTSGYNEGKPIKHCRDVLHCRPCHLIDGEDVHPHCVCRGARSDRNSFLILAACLAYGYGLGKESEDSIKTEGACLSSACHLRTQGISGRMESYKTSHCRFSLSMFLLSSMLLGLTVRHPRSNWGGPLSESNFWKQFLLLGIQLLVSRECLTFHVNNFCNTLLDFVLHTTFFFTERQALRLILEKKSTIPSFI